ncbi:hypothetical protein FCU94_17755 [Vibrio sp. JPW-9-11-11]|uniref:hypothetical protein n=1 Tax=Vibrio sp. JPW-9-11-11 TaxID=1416532 RepID=UPI0015941A11|nr:hypothetical protein [Vibrio sp. JPW-9-11-11]NVD08695.1 hypothetical protein [Vibrio sp. JPW-9-11-11]
MTIYFHLFQTNKIWQTALHQLNSDSLLRQIRVKGEVGNEVLSLDYCEKRQKGTILKQDGETIGEFSVVLA